ncbi:hypothetical protein BC828DRAFT_392587, partial [Blastocladiella britannica]
MHAQNPSRKLTTLVPASEWPAKIAAWSAPVSGWATPMTESSGVASAAMRSSAGGAVPSYLPSIAPSASGSQVATSGSGSAGGKISIRHEGQESESVLGIEEENRRLKALEAELARLKAEEGQMASREQLEGLLLRVLKQELIRGGEENPVVAAVDGD